MDKIDFQNQGDFERAQARLRYRDEAPIDAKLADLCLRDGVDQFEARPETVGNCALSGNCTFRNDKMLGISGHCLKSTVGVSFDQQ